MVNGVYRAFASHSKDKLDAVIAAAWVDVPLALGQGPGSRASLVELINCAALLSKPWQEFR